MATLADLFETYIDEAVRQAVLYHGTGPDEAEKILHDDIINASTTHYMTPLMVTKGVNKRINIGARKKELNQFDNASGVSLTRDPRFARIWTSGEGVVFFLDAEKLKRKFRIIPFDYFRNRKESEEFVIGPIAPVSSYIVAIEMSEDTARGLEDDNSLYEEGSGPYSRLLSHPLLRVNGKIWHGMTGKIIKPKS